MDIKRYYKPINTLAIIVLISLPVMSQASDDQGMQTLKSECTQCHDITGPAPATLKGLWARKAPDLFYAGNKYKAEWLTSWLQKPTRIRPAGMYYGNHIKTGEKQDVVDKASLVTHPKLNLSTAKAVTTSLMSLKGKSDLIKKDAYKEGKISISSGEMLFDKFRGCLACHQIEPGYGGLSGSEVYTAADRLQTDYLISFMANPKAWDPKTFMPNRRLREHDLQKFVYYFNALAKEDF